MIAHGQVSLTAAKATPKPASIDEATLSKLQFPWKLHQLLDYAVVHDDEGIISWLPNGRAFKIHNRIKFCGKYMKLFFKSTNYKSFHRNLNLWGFETVRQGQNKGCCYNPYFIRGAPERCYMMKRIKLKDGGEKSNGGGGHLLPLLTNQDQHHHGQQKAALIRPVGPSSPHLASTTSTGSTTSLPTSSTAAVGDLLKLNPAALVQQQLSLNSMDSNPAATGVTNLNLVLGHAIRDAVLKEAAAKQAAAASVLLAAQHRAHLPLPHTMMPATNKDTATDLARLAIASALDVLLPRGGGR